MSLDEEISRTKEVPGWLRNKIDQRYVESQVFKENGLAVLSITVGGREVVRKTAKAKPVSDDEWQRISDLLELNHYMNWMRRFCEAIGRVDDEGTRKAAEESEMPRGISSRKLLYTIFERLPEWLTAFLIGAMATMFTSEVMKGTFK